MEMLANVIQNLYEMWVYSYPREIYAIVVLGWKPITVDAKLQQNNWV